MPSDGFGALQSAQNPPSHLLWLLFQRSGVQLSTTVFVATALGLSGLSGWSFTASPVRAQPSGAVQRRFQDQQLRDQLQELDRQQQRDGQERLQAPSPQPALESGDQPGSPGQEGLRELQLEGGASLPRAQQRLLQRRFVGQPLTARLLQELRQEVVLAYDRSKILAVVAEPQEKPGGLVIVPVLEARLGKVLVGSNPSPVRSEWARETVLASVPAGQVLRLDKLESALIKLNDLAGLRASGTLKPGAIPGSSDVVLSLDKAKRYSGTFTLNNELSQFTGAAQLEGIGTAASWFGLGDLWSLNAAVGGDETGYGVRRAQASLDLPITPDGLRLLASAGWSDYRLLQDLAEDNLVGSTRSFSVGLRQPFWRRPKASLFGQLGYDQYRAEDFVLGEEYSNRVNHAMRATAVATTQDRLFGTGLNSFVLIGSVGELDKSANAFEQAVDQAFANTAGTWGKVQMIASRMQMFRDSLYSLEVFVQGQKAFKNLGSEEKFSIGWPNGVRAYPPGEASGDSGASVQLTLRRQLGPQWMLRAFVDAAYIWRWSEGFADQPQPDSFGLWGPGVGLDYGEYGKSMLSVNVGFPIGDNPNLPTGDDADGLNPGVRVWLSGKVWL